MNKIFLALAAMLVFIACPVNAENRPEPVSSAVKIALPGGHGSGAYLGNGYVVTAAHVVSGKSTVQVIPADGHAVDGTVVMVDNIDDVAFVKVDALPNVTASRLACRAPVIGEEIMVTGDPLDLDNISSWGRIAGLPRAVGTWRLATVVDVTIAPGNSGGPMYDSSGRILGIVVGIPVHDGMTFAFSLAVPSTTICSLYDAIGLTAVAMQ